MENLLDETNKKKYKIIAFSRFKLNKKILFE